MKKKPKKAVPVPFDVNAYVEAQRRIAEKIVFSDGLPAELVEFAKITILIDAWMRKGGKKPKSWDVIPEATK